METPPPDIARFAAAEGEPFPALDCPGPMAARLRAHHGRLIHKWEHYLPLYDRYFSPYRDGFTGRDGVTRPLRLLEIGVSQGGSLVLWRGYFGPAATIFGIDIEPRCAAFDGEAAQVRIGSQADPNFLAAVVAEMGGVDVVIDDGSHVASHQRASIETLYPLLTPGGIYLVEDTHTAYWDWGFEGGFQRPGSFVELAKGLIDDLHGAWHGRPASAPWAEGWLTGLHAHDSMIVLDKQARPRLSHGMRGTASF
jgi:hypothetical protein